MSRLLDLLAGRARFFSLLFTGVGILFAAYYWYQLAATTGLPVDVHAYWVADPNNLYPPADSPLHDDAYLYSPAFEALVGWGRHLSFEVFTAIWRALLLVTLVWLAGPFTVFVLFTVPVASEINAGNIQLLMAAAIVLACRRPAAWAALWAFVVLTKVTPGVGVLWFAVRREWRHLAVAVGATVAIAAVTFAIWPDRWLDWIALLASGGTPEPLAPYFLPFWPRFIVAVLIVVIGAWRGWRWPVVVGATLALPAFYTISPALLVGVLPFLREALGRWAAQRVAATSTVMPA
ncbi:MAG TPA: glycosyltransferase family 87 protein [Candidatus Limnocylindria bacterium]|nr:glycosyltransferase family 87 protein [Candidatus Limnocylindria bacterium]